MQQEEEESKGGPLVEVTLQSLTGLVYDSSNEFTTVQTILRAPLALPVPLPICKSRPLFYVAILAML